MQINLNSDVKCANCPIRHRAICARCDEVELAQLEAIKVYRSFEPDQPIFWRGDDLAYVASVVSGVATLGKTLEDGRTQTVGLLLASDFIGRPGRKTIDFDVTAVTETTLCCFDRKPFEQMIATTPHLSQRLVEMTLDELDAAQDWMVLLGRKTAREKVSSFLEMLAMRQTIDTLTEQKPELALPLTRDAIANYLGLTLETVSRQMSKLKADGIVAFTDRKRFQVLDRQGLKLATGNDSDFAML